MFSALSKPITLAILLFLSFQTHADPLTDSQLQSLMEKSKSGDISSRVELAERYYAGDGIEKDLNQSAALYQQLAEDEVAQAQMTLALMYIRGEGVEKDDQKALQWLTKAAEQRLAPAQYFLGVAYAEGHGVEPNNITAYMWYEIAAAMDYSNAVEAVKKLAKTMTPADIATAEAQATQWWMRFHH